MVSWDNLRQVLERLRSMPAATAKPLMKQYGITKLHFPLDPAYIPHTDPTTDTPVDGLHAFPDGLLRSEGAWLFFCLFKLGLDLHKVNRAINLYPNWPDDVRVPPLHSKLTKGARGGKAKSTHTLKMTGSQVYHFAMHR